MSRFHLNTAKVCGLTTLVIATLATSPLQVAAHSKTDAQQQHDHQHDHNHQQQHKHAPDHKHDHDHKHEHDHDDFASPGTHVHGQATLTMVLEGNEAMLALQSAAFNIVGFEHAPKTAEQRQEINAALDVLRQGKWFTINPQAGCDMTESDANTDLTAEVAGSHGDFYANLSLLCQQPARVNTLTINLFSLVPSLEKVTVQWVINGQQGAAELSLGSNTVSF